MHMKLDYICIDDLKTFTNPKIPYRRFIDLEDASYSIRFY